MRPNQMLPPDYLLKSANSIYHDGFRQHLLRSEFFARQLQDDFPSLNDPSDFLQLYPEWIASSRLNGFTGLGGFASRYIALGVTQAIDEWHFVCRREGRRLRLLCGEYPYSRDAWGEWHEDQYIDLSQPLLGLVKGDAVIVSAPFSASGDLHPQWSQLLGVCESLEIPVFVDAAFFGTCGGVYVDFSSPAIQAVSFSTTKGLGCGNWRAGLTFARRELPHLRLQNEWRHGIHLNVKTSLCLMREFSPDFIFETYRETQLKVCAELGLTASSTVHLATGGEEWNEFSRDGYCNRVGIAKAIRDYHRHGQFPKR